MRHYIFIILIFFLVTTQPIAAQNQSFLSGFEDIPLMEGMKQIEQDNFSFGNEEARYIETVLVSKRKKGFNDVQQFYQETLKQLGWTLEKSTSSSLLFYRENDVLEILKIAKSPLKISIVLKNRN